LLDIAIIVTTKETPRALFTAKRRESAFRMKLKQGLTFSGERLHPATMSIPDTL
jgi:hypothetical protein